jgi:hypothetical protein
VRQSRGSIVARDNAAVTAVPKVRIQLAVAQMIGLTDENAQPGQSTNDFRTLYGERRIIDGQRLGQL